MRLRISCHLQGLDIEKNQGDRFLLCSTPRVPYSISAALEMQDKENPDVRAPYTESAPIL